MLVDLRPVGLTGKEAEARLDAVGITVNKNAIPYDPEKPFIASGIRVGTPAITTCGMKEEEVAEVGRLIARTLKDDSDAAKARGRAEVTRLTDAVPALPGRRLTALIALSDPGRLIAATRDHRIVADTVVATRWWSRRRIGCHRPPERSQGPREAHSDAGRDRDLRSGSSGRGPRRSFMPEFDGSSRSRPRSLGIVARSRCHLRCSGSSTTSVTFRPR